MKAKKSSFTCFLLATCLLLAGPACMNASANQSDGTDESVIKVLTYNIGGSGQLEEVCEIVRAQNPDIVSLQEVERYSRTLPGDTPKELSDALGMNYYYYVHAINFKSEDGGGERGNLILSKYPIIDFKGYRLGRQDNDDVLCPFGYVLLEKDGKRFYFASVQLDGKDADDTRAAQVRELFQLISPLGDAAILLAGDMNTKPFSTTLTDLQAKFATTQSAPVTVIPDEGDSYTSDWIMYTSGSGFGEQSYEAVGTTPSTIVGTDHLPVVATYTIQ